MGKSAHCPRSDTSSRLDDTQLSSQTSFWDRNNEWGFWVKYGHGNWFVLLIEIQSALSASSKYDGSQSSFITWTCVCFLFSCDWKNISLWNLTRSWEKVSAGAGQWSVASVGGARNRRGHLMHSMQSQNCVYSLPQSQCISLHFFHYSLRCGSATHSAVKYHGQAGLCSQPDWLFSSHDLPKRGQNRTQSHNDPLSTAVNYAICNIRHSDQTPACHDW